MGPTVLLSLGLALLTFSLWERASLSAAETNIGKTPQRYCYTSTTSRRLLVATGFCLLVLAVVGLPAYLLTRLFWSLPNADQLFSDDLWFWIVAAAAVGIVAFAFRLPGLREARRQVRQIVLRHQFFPVLPTEYEQDIIQQLLSDSKRRRDSAIAVDGGETAEICRAEAELLERVHGALAAKLNGRARLLKIFWLGPEWDLADTLYKRIQVQLARHPACYSPLLVEQLRLCQYYCFHLIARYIFATSVNREQALAKFAEFGFAVRLAAKPRSILI